MKIKNINNNSNNLLIIFNGWGFDDKILQLINLSNYDIMLFYQYTDFNLDNVRICKKYHKISVIAWSLGVWIAPIVIEKLNIKIDNAIAINGTLNPISDNYGIPNAVFQGTLNNLSERNLQKFNTRIAGGAKEFALVNEYFPIGNWQTRKDELQFLFDSICANTVASNIYKNAIIGTNDLIFSTENQRSFWQTTNTTITEYQGAHLIFDKINISKFL